MNCPLCNYSMDAFDKVCPRCKGKGLTAPPATPQAQQAPVQNPVPVVPSAQSPTSQVNPALGNQIPAINAGWPTDDKYIFAFTGAVIAFCIGYLAPWINLGAGLGLGLGFGQGLGIGGGMGLEFMVFLTAIAAAGVSWYEKLQTSNDLTSQLRSTLTAICVVFALSEALYFGFMIQILPLGFGLPLMVISALLMAYFDLAYFSKANGSPVFPIACGALILCLGWSGYKGYELRKGFTSPLLTAAAFQPEAFQPPSAIRDDVEIKVNSVVAVAVLQPDSNFYKPFAPDPGKTFLNCNITVTYKGDANNLYISESNFSANASNKQVYRSKSFMASFQNFTPISATLLPGGTVTGNIIFEVDSNAQIEKVLYSLW